MAKEIFPARYKGPFDRRKARMDFSAFVASQGDGLTISALLGDANWKKLEAGDRPATQWGDGAVGRTDGAAVKVASPWRDFSVTTTGFSGPDCYVDLVLDGGELGATYLVTVGFRLSNGDEIQRSAAITIAFL